MRKNNENFYSEIDIYVGIDVHKKSWNVSIYSGSIYQQKPLSISPPSTDILIKYLREHYPGGIYHIVYEAGFSGYWIYDQLTEIGIDCKVVSPADIPRSDKTRNFKTDKLDSKKLAKNLMSGSLEFIDVPEKKRREHRELLRLRNKYVKNRARLKNYIKSNILFYGLSRENNYDDLRCWSKKYIASLSSLKYQTKQGKFTMNKLKEMLLYYNQLIKDIDKEIKQLSLSKQYKEDVEILCSVPGISTLSAMTLLLEIGDFNRFTNTSKLKSYAGLIPREYSSGDKVLIGGITKRGNKNIKRIIIEASWIAIGRDKGLSSLYLKLLKRKRGSKAIITISGVLLNRIRSIMRKKEHYKIAM